MNFTAVAKTSLLCKMDACIVCDKINQLKHSSKATQQIARDMYSTLSETIGSVCKNDYATLQTIGDLTKSSILPNKNQQHQIKILS